MFPGQMAGWKTCAAPNLKFYQQPQTRIKTQPTEISLREVALALGYAHKMQGKEGLSIFRSALIRSQDLRYLLYGEIFLHHWSVVAVGPVYLPERQWRDVIHLLDF